MSLAGEIEELVDAPVTPDHSAPDVRHPPWAFIALAALAGSVLLVTLLGATIARGTQFAFDRAILLAMRTGDGAPAGPDGLATAMVDLTALGGRTVLTSIVALTIGYLLIHRHRLTALLVFGGTLSGSVAVSVIKRLVGRERPDLFDHLVEIGAKSFPSGHSANSAIIYLTIALMLMQIVEKRAARWYLFAAAVLLVTAIGSSRVYLGVHWPSDVLAGWAFGSLWALAWWSLGAWLRTRLPHGGQDDRIRMSRPGLH